VTLRNTLRRLACRALDLVTVEQLREATSAVDARWAGEQIAHRARLVELERRLREAMTLPRGADPPSLADRLASGDWVVLGPQGEGGAPLCGTPFRAHPDCPEPCPADCSLAIGAATGICGLEGEGEGEGVRHAVKESGDCAEWCRQCAKDEEKMASRPALQIACPDCKSGPGEPCRGANGDLVEWVCGSRIKAAGGEK